MSSPSTESKPQRREGVPETECTLADTLINRLPEQALRDILRSLSYLAPVHRAIEAYARSCQTPSPSQPSTQQRPAKRRILQPAYFSPTASHHTHLSSANELPWVHSLEDIHRQGSAQDSIHTGTYAGTGSNTEGASPELRRAQEALQRLLILVRKVNVFYSHTLHVPDSVVSLLNIANNAVDPQSIPIRSAAALSSMFNNHAESQSNPNNPRKRAHQENERAHQENERAHQENERADDRKPRCRTRGLPSTSSSSSSLPTPSASPSIAMTEACFQPQRYGDLVVDPSSNNTHSSSTSPSSTSLPQEYLELLADRILSSLTMMLIEHPPSRYQPRTKPSVSESNDADSMSVEVTDDDDCDLSDALLEMVYTLLEQSLYRERPLAKQLSDVLLRIALGRERRFQALQRQQEQQQQQQPQRRRQTQGIVVDKEESDDR
ncbi:hypothetical protein BGZ75_008143 [Mortierella antarctica]|nr:hypothetical protein BGZ75_008143 [Mortierella antarctica]